MYMLLSFLLGISVVTDGKISGGLCSSGKSQSPIDFKRKEVKLVFKRPLKFSGQHQTPVVTNITNTGSTVQIHLRTSKPITVTGGVFDNQVYVFQQLHFHWGKNLHEGGEHTVDSRRFPLECHLVFYKSNSRKKRQLIPRVGGVAVIGVHYEVRSKGSHVLSPIIHTMKRITKEGESVLERGGYHFRSYLPDKFDTYFSYTGSLTTPPCTEGVRWIWFAEKQDVTQHQVQSFKSITDNLGHKVKANFRGTQPINGRTVNLVKTRKKNNKRRKAKRCQQRYLQEYSWKRQTSSSIKIKSQKLFHNNII